jgi:hypothetical protein
MAHDVFISYSTKDKLTADAVCAILESHGLRCWVAPRDIMPGADWGESIVNSIRASRVMLLVFSTNANNSKQIKREVEIAADSGVTIVPLRIEDILPTESFKYFLGNIHWMDALTPPVEKHLEAIAEKVKAILSVDSPNLEEVPGTTSSAKSLERESLSLELRDTTGGPWRLLRRPRFIAALLGLVLVVSVVLAISMPSTEPVPCRILKDSTVYDAPSGNENGMLEAGTEQVSLLETRETDWFNVEWPAGQGWVFSGPGYENAIECQ